MCTTSSTPTNLTRYRDPVAKPRTPKGRAKLTIERLAERYPGTAKELCALDHQNPFQLLAATILSAQSTDARVNMVTPLLFAAYPDAHALAAANPEAVEEIIHTTGFFRSKTKSLIGMATAVVERYDGEVPRRSRTWSPCPASVARPATWSAAWTSTCPGSPSTPTCCAAPSDSASPSGSPRRSVPMQSKSSTNSTPSSPRQNAA